MTKNVLRYALSAMLLALGVPAEAQQPQNIPRIRKVSLCALRPDKTKSWRITPRCWIAWVSSTRHVCDRDSRLAWNVL